MEVVVTAGANRCAKLQSNDHHQQTNTSYLQFGCPSRHPTNSVKAQLQLTVIYNDDKQNSCHICSARITTNKMIHSACNSTGVGSGGWGYAGDLTPSTIYVDGILICISSVENLIPSHANCMQHVLRYWERQSDGSEYKKALRRPWLRPGPR